MYLILLSVKQGGIIPFFLVFGMTRPGIEPRSPRPLAKTVCNFLSFMLVSALFLTSFFPLSHSIFYIMLLSWSVQQIAHHSFFGCLTLCSIGCHLSFLFGLTRVAVTSLFTAIIPTASLVFVAGITKKLYTTDVYIHFISLTSTGGAQLLHSSSTRQLTVTSIFQASFYHVTP